MSKRQKGNVRFYRTKDSSTSVFDYYTGKAEKIMNLSSSGDSTMELVCPASEEADVCVDRTSQPVCTHTRAH